MGIIGLPLSEGDAQRIQSNEPSFENGQVATWEVSLRNPACQEYMKEVVEKISTHLGSKDVAVQLDTMLLESQKTSVQSALSPIDTTTSTGIGYLALCLPSSHSGGDVSLSHAAQKNQISTSESSQFDGSMCIWY